ncbi:MAG: SDR family NAD(P)-dependent oxidoreductase [Deltaproteobacteria bacterium]|nr:SDR family NAD(P)-dependent oxidoreductase [Deltaproteobacteria bacterium]MBW2033129.1 SDR family NAD(P)-dependent oxidoreductase [Deltaproteobacteria bacterium]MBW2301500.1 SDR family NAD(P)-dependent oxidoreductase [Deltaproteobacteria bacterium]
MKGKRRIVVVGATSAIASHCARLWLENQPSDLTLVGRNAQRTDRVASDLKVRSPESLIRVVCADFLDPEVITTTVENIFQSGDVDIVLIAHGSLPEQVRCQNDLKACCQALNINGVSPVLFAEAFAKQMAKSNHGTIALIGSVAGDRGRKSNYVYGAGKGLITRYAQGLQHRFAHSRVKVVLIKPGPTDTPMAADLKDKGTKLAPVEKVAKEIVEGIEAGRPVIYTPRKWWLIMMVIQHLPAFVFNKLNI